MISPHRHQNSQGRFCLRIVGFRLGGSREDAEAACRAAGHEVVGTDDRFTCSGLASDSSAAATAHLVFSNGVLGLLEVEIVPKPEDDLALKLESVKDSLVERYGEPQKNDVRLPRDCMGERLRHCLVGEKAHFGFWWSWSTGESVGLTLGDRAKPPPLPERRELAPFQFKESAEPPPPRREIAVRVVYVMPVAEPEPPPDPPPAPPPDPPQREPDINGL